MGWPLFALFIKCNLILMCKTINRPVVIKNIKYYPDSTPPFLPSVLLFLFFPQNAQWLSTYVFNFMQNSTRSLYKNYIYHRHDWLISISNCNHKVIFSSTFFLSKLITFKLWCKKRRVFIIFLPFDSRKRIGVCFKKEASLV